MSDDTLPFPDISYPDENLTRLWRDIRDNIAESGRVSAPDILENRDQLNVAYTEDTLRADILPKLRQALRRKDIIDVEIEQGDPQGNTRKIWILQGE
jgi:hypothetical protein